MKTRTPTAARSPRNPSAASKPTKQTSARAPSSRLESAELEIEGRTVPVSNLGKVLYPKASFTKSQLIDYYIRISPVLLPHLKGRPLTLKRYPNGVEGPHFYEKRCPSHRPKWVRTAPVRRKGNNADIHFCLANDLPTLVWAANLADLELHTSLSLADALESPTAAVFDLDPGAPANVIQCAEVAWLMKELFDALKLQSFPKTSGSKGLQVYLPLNGTAAYEETKPFARTVAEIVERRRPDLVVSKMRKDLRKGKVFVDWSQNDAHKTTVSVYSLRAKEVPTVSTPVEWKEVRAALRHRDPSKLSFEWNEVLKRVDKQGDLFAPVVKLKQRLPTPNRLRDIDSL